MKSFNTLSGGTTTRFDFVVFILVSASVTRIFVFAIVGPSTRPSDRNVFGQNYFWTRSSNRPDGSSSRTLFIFLSV